MNIDDLVKIASIFDGNSTENSLDENHGLCIIVLDKGFVFVGELSTNEKWVSIKNARPIIRWGTTGGLTELANKGPLENTKLGDAQDTINKSPIAALINIIPCQTGSW